MKYFYRLFVLGAVFLALICHVGCKEHSNLIEQKPFSALGKDADVGEVKKAEVKEHPVTRPRRLFDEFAVIEPQKIEGNRTVAWRTDGTPIAIANIQFWNPNDDAANGGAQPAIEDIFVPAAEVRVISSQSDVRFPNIDGKRQVKVLDNLQRALNESLAKLIFVEMIHRDWDFGHVALVVIDRRQTSMLSIEFYDSLGPNQKVAPMFKDAFAAVEQTVHNQVTGKQVSVKIHSGSYQEGGRCYLHARNTALARYEGTTFEEFAATHQNPAPFTPLEVQRLQLATIGTAHIKRIALEFRRIGKAIWFGADHDSVMEGDNLTEILEFSYAVANPQLTPEERNALILDFGHRAGLDDSELARRVAWARANVIEPEPSVQDFPMPNPG